ncbi:hypothetical protein [Nocardioides sp. YIM 152588]|uniref:hypothetical protein n=1 Tax=Nocardioides sp. YIM 152588 TaxID=3158259 RepID=UPI0032E3824E
MSDEQPRSEGVHRPLLEGLVAMVAVALTVGLIMAGAALFASRFLGLGGPTAGAASTERESMVIPRPERTSDPTGPLVTLHTQAPEKKAKQEKSDSAEKKEKKAEKKAITLSANQSTVSSFGRIDLTGIYPGGEGAVLQVQRFESGKWADFEATIPVSGETFSTYVQTGVSGVNRFRVLDRSTGKASNEVRITVQ